jgi:thiamine-monophosphate kinase
MKISDIGGEFELLRRLTRRDLSDPRLVLGVGDDCALLQYTADVQLLVTTDMMVENDHFSTVWQTPFQIGMKLMEVNVSDIVCKGGRPKFAFLSMCLQKETTVGFVEELYRGLYASAAKHGVMLVGGDTTHGRDLVFNIALVGEVEPGLFRPRSGAKAGDLIAVTGTLGGSTAGLELLRAGMTGHTLDHLEPKSRLAAEGRSICRFAHATIDVSDGLGSEVTHIARESGLGAVIDYANIPYSSTTIESARKLERDPADFALYGGEDFQIVFTLPGEKVPLLKKEFDDFTIVGEMLGAGEMIALVRDGRREPLKRGYDHFA